MPLDSDALAIARAGIRAVDPARCLREHLRLRGGTLTAGRRRIDIGSTGRVPVLALGKAAGSMAREAVRILGRREGDVLVVLREGDPAPQLAGRVLWGEHPVPGSGSHSAGRAALEFVRAQADASLVLFLLSGGGSALVEVPPPRVAMSSVARTTQLLLASGAPIQQMNIVRRHISQLKGGWLGAAREGRPALTLAISDVVGDTPWDIASGPTVADPTSFAQALSAVRRWGLLRALPHDVQLHLERGARGEAPENPKPGDPRIARSRVHLVASNRVAVNGSAQEARRRGYRAVVDPQPVTGETQPKARRVGRSLARSAERRPGGSRGRAFLSGGETTVTLGRRAGKGGRNQEFALTVARQLDGVADVAFVSLGTDGVDGPTDAAGASVDGTTWRKVARFERDPAEVLREHRTYPALDRIGALVRTGPTGTNVTDIHVGLIGPRRTGTAGSSRRDGARASRRRRT